MDALQKIANKPLTEMTDIEYAVWRLYVLDEDNKSAIAAAEQLARLSDLQAVAEAMAKCLKQSKLYQEIITAGETTILPVVEDLFDEKDAEALSAYEKLMEQK